MDRGHFLSQPFCLIRATAQVRATWTSDLAPSSISLAAQSRHCRGPTPFPKQYKWLDVNQHAIVAKRQAAAQMLQGVLGNFGVTATSANDFGAALLVRYENVVAGSGQARDNQCASFKPQSLQVGLLAVCGVEHRQHAILRHRVQQAIVPQRRREIIFARKVRLPENLGWKVGRNVGR